MNNTITQNEYNVLRGLKNGYNLTEISEYTNTPYSTITSSTATLVKKGLVKSRGKRKTPFVFSNVDLRRIRHRVS